MTGFLQDNSLVYCKTPLLGTFRFGVRFCDKTQSNAQVYSIQGQPLFSKQSPQLLRRPISYVILGINIQLNYNISNL
jgi:hypothetical protein